MPGAGFPHDYGGEDMAAAAFTCPRAGRGIALFRRTVILAACLLSGTGLGAQEPLPPSVEDTQIAGESSAEPPARRLVKWNEYEGPLFTLRVSAGVILDAGTYAQDQASREQFALEPGSEVRDFRVMLNGRIKTKRQITWCAGFMYDGTSHEWLVRQTGVMIAVPELKGHVFIGRSKEGISVSMVMVGYSGWTMERSPAVVATVPLLADGIKWMGYFPKRHFLYNVGWYTDVLSEGQSFSSYDQQFVARVGWVPILQENGTLLHVALAGRYGVVNDQTLRLRSRPELSIAPYFVDTEPFAAHDTRLAQGEVYYRPGPWLFGAEYFVQRVNALQGADPLFHGGDAVASWLITGETRKYNTAGGYFLSVSPHRTVFEGGPGAWEALLKLSYIDLNDGPVHGGRFWRLTPMVNWYLTDQLRLEFAYGVGRLDRFGLLGTTQFLQTRLQFQF
jgi:phosphate-selective porin OprO/OprP